jgi:hypothetical protein
MALPPGRASGRTLAGSSAQAAARPVRLLCPTGSGRQGPDRAEDVSEPGDVSRVMAGLPPTLTC